MVSDHSRLPQSQPGGPLILPTGTALATLATSSTNCLCQQSTETFVTALAAATFGRLVRRQRRRRRRRLSSTTGHGRHKRGKRL